MERPKYLIVFLFFIFYFSNIYGTYKSDIYNAYINDNMTKWKEVIDEMNNSQGKRNGFVLELINYQYGYIAWCIAENKKREAEHYIELAQKNLDLLEIREYELSTVNSYKSALNGYRIALNRFQAPFLGPKSIEFAEKAIELDKNNPYGYIQYGNARYYSPSIFGGSKTVALENFSKAKSLIELDKEEIKNNWNYLSLLVIIAQAHSHLGEYNIAKKYYKKILDIEPNFLWVKNELLPELLNKS